jgi:hypothetical protein
LVSQSEKRWLSRTSSIKYQIYTVTLDKELAETSQIFGFIIYVRQSYRWVLQGWLGNATESLQPERKKSILKLPTKE